MSKDAMLTAITAALKDVPETEMLADVPVAREYLRQDGLSQKERLELFVERIEDYKVTVRQLRAKEISQQIAASCAARQAQKLVIPQDVPQDWLPDNLSLIPDHNLSYEALDQSQGVITGCAVAIAQTGTIVLDAGANQGRRALSLLPDYHLCIVYETQIVGTVPEAFTKLEPSVKAGKPITFISGPSATSDIELNRVEGVHGPRILEVLLVKTEVDNV